MPRATNTWSCRKEEILVDLRDNQCIEWKYIGIRLGKSDGACKDQYHRIKKRERQREIQTSK